MKWDTLGDPKPIALHLSKDYGRIKKGSFYLGGRHISLLVVKHYDRFKPDLSEAENTGSLQSYYFCRRSAKISRSHKKKKFR